MSIDEALLARARQQAEKLAEAERQVLVARGEYHVAVRRLHLAGASLRDVAQALNVSHQRVQQMVDAAGGSWWQRAWGSRKRRAAVCTFCERPPSEVAKLIAGPDVFICDGCVEHAEGALNDDNTSGSFARSAGRCSFCGRRGTSSRAVAANRAGRVCEACVRTCRGILNASAA